MSIVLYILSIIAANVVTAALQPFHIVGFIVPAGSFLIGVTLLLRNAVQVKSGRRMTYLAIVTALIASALTSHSLGDSLAITGASAVSFLVSEVADTETFSRVRFSLAGRILAGGAVGSVLDSVVFVTLGLSPIGAGFLPWVAVPMAILGQLIVKFGMQAIASGVIGYANRADQLQ